MFEIVLVGGSCSGKVIRLNSLVPVIEMSVIDEAAHEIACNHYQPIQRLEFETECYERTNWDNGAVTYEHFLVKDKTIK